MYCPECRKIYTEGVFRCQACDVDLVGIDPGGSTELLPVFETNNPFELGMVKSHLISAGIPVAVSGEDILHLGEAFLSAAVLVPREKAAEAAEIVAELFGPEAPRVS